MNLRFFLLLIKSFHFQVEVALFLSNSELHLATNFLIFMQCFLLLIEFSSDYSEVTKFQVKSSSESFSQFHKSPQPTFHLLGI